MKYGLEHKDKEVVERDEDKREYTKTRIGKGEEARGAQKRWK